MESFLPFNSGYCIEPGVQYLLQQHLDAFVAAFAGIDGPEHAHATGASLWREFDGH